MRYAVALILLMAAPAMAAEVPLPPERPDAPGATEPAATEKPDTTERPGRDDASKLAPRTAAEPARKALPEHAARDPDTGRTSAAGGDLKPVNSAARHDEPTPANLTPPKDTSAAVGKIAVAPLEPITTTRSDDKPGTIVNRIPAARPDAVSKPARGDADAPDARPATASEAEPAPDGDLVAPPVPPVKPEATRLRTAMIDRPTTDDRPRTGGVVCGDPRLIGRMKPTVTGRHPGCLITEPVEVTAIAGVRLSTPATLSCRTARAFANWIMGVADPAARQMLGGRITRVWLMGSYACRTRNSLRGKRLSEHAVGRAVDVGGFTLADGRKIRVKSDWRRGAPGKFLRHVWKRGCGMFKTVLGPDGDRFHQDHIHLDVAFRKLTYCR